MCCHEPAAASGERVGPKTITGVGKREYKSGRRGGNWNLRVQPNDPQAGESNGKGERIQGKMRKGDAEVRNDTPTRKRGYGGGGRVGGGSS